MIKSISRSQVEAGLATVFHHLGCAPIAPQSSDRTPQRPLAGSLCERQVVRSQDNSRRPLRYLGISPDVVFVQNYLSTNKKAFCFTKYGQAYVSRSKVEGSGGKASQRSLTPQRGALRFYMMAVKGKAPCEKK